MNTAQFSDVIATFEKVMSYSKALKLARCLDGAECPTAAALLLVHALQRNVRNVRQKLEDGKKAIQKTSEKAPVPSGAPWAGRHIQSFGGGAGGGIRRPDRLPQTKTEFQSLKYPEILWIQENTPEIYSKFMSRDPWRA